MSNGSEDFRNRGDRNNFPGFAHPLMLSLLTPKYKDAMITAIWKSHPRLRGFIPWARHMRLWTNQDLSDFVDEHINDTPPNLHYVFRIDGDVVGVGSLVRAYENDIQIALWVTTGYQGKGIGKAIVKTLTSIAFEVWGYPVLYFEADTQNEFSLKLPKQCGFEFSHTKRIKEPADLECGVYSCWKQTRPDGLPDGIFQGRPIDDFIVP